MAAPTPPADTSSPPAATLKPIHSLVLDTGPLIKNDPPVDVLRARSEQLYILPSVIPEIRDAATRSRLETAVLPFVKVRSPKPESVKFISGFARRTGDLEVLSRPDLEVLSLTYELECERNGGDWRLRNTPGQKTLNGRPPAKEGQSSEEGKSEERKQKQAEAGEDSAPPTTDTAQEPSESLHEGMRIPDLKGSETGPDPTTTDSETAEVEAHNEAHEAAGTSDLSDHQLADGEKANEDVVYVEEAEGAEDNQENAPDAQKEEEDDDDGGWITPSNIKKHKAKDTNTSTVPGQQPATLQAAVLTSDFAMQNVALRMNLNLVSPALDRISRLRTWVLRCHGCFKITRDMSRRFCPTCGQQTLIRAACTVDDRTGQLTVHLKRNFQWNNRGNVYSVPKPVHGTANGRIPNKGKSGGGKNGWGQGLILAEDQKEHVQASNEQRRARKKDIMDEDYLPGILTGDRGAGAGGRIRVGAGRNVNARKRH